MAHWDDLGVEALRGGLGVWRLCAAGGTGLPGWSGEGPVLGSRGAGRRPS